MIKNYIRIEIALIKNIYFLIKKKLIKNHVSLKILNFPFFKYRLVD